MASTTISIRTASNNQYGEVRGGMLPNSPTSMASQSRRLRLSGAVNPRITATTPSTGAIGGNSNNNIYGSQANKHTHTNTYTNTNTNTNTTRSTVNHKNITGTDGGNSSVAHLKQMFEPKYQQQQQQEDHQSVSREQSTPSRSSSQRFSYSSNVRTETTSNDNSVGGGGGESSPTPSRKEHKNHNFNGLGQSHNDNDSHSHRQFKNDESRHESAIRTSPGYEKYKNLREERQGRHRRLQKDHFEEMDSQDNNVPMNTNNSSVNSNSNIANQNIINGLSERRRKMAMAKKHARSSMTTSSSQQCQNNQFNYNSDFDRDSKGYNTPTSEGLDEPHQQQTQPQQQQQQTPSPSSRLNTKSKRRGKGSPKKKRDSLQESERSPRKGSKKTTFKDNVKDDSSNDDANHNSKYPASPSRRRKFEIVKESLKQRRHGHNPSQHQNQNLEMNANANTNTNSEKELKVVDTHTNASTTSERGVHVSSSIMMKLESARNVGNGNSTTRTLSTASLSTSTFETFESDIFQNQQINPSASNRMAVVDESNPGLFPEFSNSRQGGGGNTHLNNRGDMNDFSSSSRKNFTKLQQSNNINNNNLSSDFHAGFGQTRPTESPRQNEKNSPSKNKNKKSSKSPSWRRNRSYSQNHNHSEHEMLIQEGARNIEEKLHYNQSPITNSEYGSPGQSSHQRPQYFAPPNNNTWDDDDETQFNSVTENTDRRRGINADLPTHPLQSNTMSTKSDKSLSFFASGFGGSSRRVVDLPFTRSSNTYDNIENDDESYNGSIGNGSWTGRMRARQGMHYNPGVVMEKDDSLRNSSPSKRSVYSIEDDTELSRFSASQILNTNDIVNTPACSDATKGVEEIKRFAKEDPTTTAVGVGVCGALCGALALGTAGFVLAAGAVGACYGVSQLPEDKRIKIKKKASVTVEKISSKTAVASEFVSNSCGNVCGTVQTPMKQNNGETDTTSSRSLGPSNITNGDTIDRMKNMSPQHEGINGGSSRISPGLVRSKSSQHEMKQQETNAFLAQNNSGKFNRLVPACCRMTRITPVNQIHSLDPSLHSRAWLDVMASAWTSRDEKNEAMEEILLLAKDRSRAKMLLEEGILDSLMYILREFFQQYVEKVRLSGKDTLPVEAYMGDPNFFHSKLAANCCVALAKAYCSATVHTEVNDFSHSGGLSLPVSQQVAQLLYEIPHHMAVIVPDAKEGEKKEVFRLTTEMTLQLANDLGSSITSLTLGRLEINTSEK